MPRTREFDETEALDAAVRVFWQKGYEAAAIGEIVAAAHASRYGLYEVFGDKRDLFLRALDRYRETVIGGYVGGLAHETAGLTEIHAYFKTLIAMTDQPEIRYGCLLVTAAVGLSVEDEAVRRKVHDYFDWLAGLFERALKNAIAAGKFPAETDAHALAVYLMGLVQGGAVLARSGTGRSTIETYLRTGLRSAPGLGDQSE